MNKKHKRVAGELYFAGFLLAFSIFVLVCAYRISGFSSVSSPGTFPMIAAAVMVITITIVLFQNRRSEAPDVGSNWEELKQAAKTIFFPTFLIYTAIIILYMILLQPLHFMPASFLFLLVSIIYLKGAPPLTALFITGVTLAGIYLIFHYLFLVVLP
jgi:putative tricarboxylic transport membrane protein